MRVPSFHICPKIYLLLSRLLWYEDLLAQPTIRLFDLLCELLFDFPFLLGADIYLLLGFTLLSAHFLIPSISCHITLSFLP